MSKDDAVLELGVELTRADVDFQRIILETVVRFFVVCLIIYAGIKGAPVHSVHSVSGAVFFVLIVLSMLGWGLLPLIHAKDYVIFYENGIEFCRKKWSFDELGEISFLEVSSNVVLFSKKYMETDVKAFNITYIKNGKKSFNKAYYKTI